MNVLQTIKFVSITPPAVIVDNAAFTTAAVDTLGFGQLCIVAYAGATDIDLTVLKVQESDASDMSGAADITGLVVGTSIDPDTGTASVLPTGTDDNKFSLFFINMQGRKRYIDVNITMGNGTVGGYVTAFALLTNGVNIPSTAAERGALLNLIV